MWHKRRILVSAIMVVALCAVVTFVAQAATYVYVSQWGSYGTGPGQFNHPVGVAVDNSGHVYVADQWNGRIEKFTRTGAYLTQWGSRGSDDGQFNGPYHIAVDGAGYVYVADGWNCRVQKFTSSGTFVTKWGSQGNDDGQFYWPEGVAVDRDGYVYVTDGYNGHVQKFTSSGTFVTKWGSPGSGDGQFNFAAAVAVGRDGNVYVADCYNNRIQKFTSEGVYLTQWGGGGCNPGQLSGPHGVTVDNSGYVYVTEQYCARIQKFTGDGAYVTQWGSSGSGDGQFSISSWGLAVNDSGQVYVADHGNNRIQTFAPVRVEIAFDFKPHDLHLNSKDKWVTGYLRPPAPYLASQIDVTSIRLNGVVAVSTEQAPKLEDHDSKLKVKFPRAQVLPTLSPGNDVPVTVTGMIAGQAFVGTDYIKVKAPKMHMPKAGDVLAAGTTTEVVWDIPDGAPAPSVTLLLSLDDGVTWTVEAEGVPNAGSYAWTVPSAASSQARLQVMLVYGIDETGVIPESEFAVSDPFVINQTTGVEGGEATLALRPASLVTGPLTVSFSLASEASATLAAYDVSGRQVVSREVGSSGAGWHTMELGSHPAGMYVVRLSQAGRTVSARVAVIR